MQEAGRGAFQESSDPPTERARPHCAGAARSSRHEETIEIVAGRPRRPKPRAPRPSVHARPSRSLLQSGHRRSCPRVRVHHGWPPPLPGRDMYPAWARTRGTVSLDDDEPERHSRADAGTGDDVHARCGLGHQLHSKSEPCVPRGRARRFSYAAAGVTHRHRERGSDDDRVDREGAVSAVDVVGVEDDVRAGLGHREPDPVGEVAGQAEFSAEFAERIACHRNRGWMGREAQAQSLGHASPIPGSLTDQPR